MLARLRVVTRANFWSDKTRLAGFGVGLCAWGGVAAGFYFGGIAVGATLLGIVLVGAFLGLRSTARKLSAERAALAQQQEQKSQETASPQQQLAPSPQPDLLAFAGMKNVGFSNLLGRSLVGDINERAVKSPVKDL